MEASLCSRAPNMYIVETARLGLRRLQESDLSDFHAIWSNRNAVQWTSYDVSNTLGDSKLLLAALSPSHDKPEPQNYGVFLRNVPHPDSGNPHEIISSRECMIGIVGVFRSAAAEAGYIFNESFWRQGYASEALAAFLNIHWRRAAADHSLPQIVTARVSPDNPASVKVLRKCGFQEVQQDTEGGKGLHFRAENPMKV